MDRKIRILGRPDEQVPARSKVCYLNSIRYLGAEYFPCICYLTYKRVSLEPYLDTYRIPVREQLGNCQKENVKYYDAI